MAISQGGDHARSGGSQSTVISRQAGWVNTNHTQLPLVIGAIVQVREQQAERRV